jgi:hypothetical protein
MSSILKLIAKGLLFCVPLLAFMVYTSYTVDPVGLFHGDQFARNAVEILLEGEYAVSNYDSLEYYTRDISEALIMNADTFDTIVIGSSRSMQIDAEMAGEYYRFFNFGAVGGDYQDLYGIFYLCVREDKIPKRVVLCLDPWMFNTDIIDDRSNRDWYLAFVKGELGFEIDYELPNPTARWKALLDISYFQSSVAYYRRDTGNDLIPSAVPLEDVYHQDSTIKMPDGTVVYEEEFRNRPLSDISGELYIHTQHANFYSFRVLDYMQPSPELQAQFEAYIEYMQARGVEVIFYLPPYAPPIYDVLLEHEEDNRGVFLTEEYLRTVAAENGIEVYGSYNPHSLDLETADFYDGLHLRPEATIRFFRLTQR